MSSSKNKGIIGLIVLIVVVLVVVVVYGYNRAPDGINQNSSNNNINGSDTITIEGPAVNVTPENFDLGTVIYGEVAEHTFVVKNLGDEPLEILRLSTSCGCTKATIAEEDKVIAPGQSVDMLVTFDPAVHKDDTDLGDLTRIVYLKTNDPENSEVEVEINAYVIKAEQIKSITVTAKQWSFEPNPIVVKKGDYVKLEITSVDVSHGFVLPDFNIDEMLQPGKKVIVEFLADKTGTFSFFCSVLCGGGHSDMRGQLIIK